MIRWVALSILLGLALPAIFGVYAQDSEAAQDADAAP